jgi:replicative DNA helicase
VTRRKVEPAIFEVERVLLATLLCRPSDCAAVEITAECFVLESHADIFHAYEALLGASKPADAVSVGDYLEQHGNAELGHLAVDIASGSLTTPVPEAYAKRVMEAWRQRKAQDIARELLDSNAPEAVDSAISALMSLHAIESKHEWTSKEATNEAWKKILELHESGGKLPGVTTGIEALDDYTGGLHDGDLIIVGARAAMGKTAMLATMFRAAAKKDGSVGVISGEQSVQQIALRGLAALGRVNAGKFRRADFQEEDWTRISNAIAQSAELPIMFLDRSAPSISEVVRVARRWKHKHKIKALYIDYLQRLAGGEGDKKHERIGDIAKSLKNLARDLGIPVIALAQVGRDVEKRANQKPHMGDLSDSSEIEKEADVIMMLYRPAYYDQNAAQDEAEVIIDKNRHGPTGYVEVRWEGQYMDFSDKAAAYSEPEW